METLTQKTTTRKPRPSKHSRQLLKLLGECQWCYLLLPSYGNVRITKREACYQIRTQGDHLTHQRHGNDLVLEVMPW